MEPKEEAGIGELCFPSVMGEGEEKEAEDGEARLSSDGRRWKR